MTKKLLIAGISLVVMLASVSNINAQKLIEFGIKGGVQAQSLKMAKTASLSTLTSSGDFGYQLGLMSRINLAFLYVQPELVYNSAYFTVKNSSNNSAKFSVNNFEVPVLLGVKLLFIRAFAGPVFNIMNETKNRENSMPTAFSTNINKATVGYNAGAGVQFGGFNVDLRYCGQFKKPIQSISVGNITSEMKSGMNSWQLNIGYFF